MIKNVPLNATQEQLENMVSKYERWTYITIMEHDKDSKAANTESDEEDGSMNKKAKKPALGYQFAKIEFDDRDALETFVDDIENPRALEDVIRIGYNKVAITRYDTVC